MAPVPHTSPAPGTGVAEPAEPSERLIARGERLQLVLSGILWMVAAGILAWRGIGWLVPIAWWPLLVAAGVALGVLKARYILRPVARKVIARIHERGPGAPIAGFFSVRSWVAVVIMMAGGHALRLTAIPRPWLGVLYVGIASALLVGSRWFWRAHALGWSEIPTPSKPR